VQLSMLAKLICLVDNVEVLSSWGGYPKLFCCWLHADMHIKMLGCMLIYTIESLS